MADDSAAPACPVPADALLAYLLPRRVRVWNARRVATGIGALVLILVLLIATDGLTFIAGMMVGWLVVEFAYPSVRRRPDRRTWEAVDWVHPDWYRSPGLGGIPLLRAAPAVAGVGIVVGPLLWLVEGHSPWWLLLLPAAGPLIWLGGVLDRPRRLELRCGETPWRIGEARRVRLDLEDGAPAFESPRAWLRVLRSVPGATPEVVRERVLFDQPGLRLAEGDSLELHVDAPADVPATALDADEVVWWELVVVGRRHGRDIRWVYLLPVRDKAPTRSAA